MRQFSLILCFCLAAVASADKLGYNYQPVAHSPSGLSFQPSGLASNEAPAFAAGPSFHNEAPNFAPAPASPIDGPIGASSSGSPNYAAPQAELEKEFFTYTADEGDFYDPAASEQVSSSLNKALRVVFIKGPENRGLENAALALAKQAAQQETAIYVLNKQADIGDLANKLNAIRSGDNSNNKPEVHFVKYRTPEDAANAQKAIQGQYDQLGGSSQSTDGGVAPALNFASSAPAPVAAAPGSGISQGPFVPVGLPEATAPISSYVPPPTPGSTYLPANILRRLRF
ncbi:uncharacterized protein LOC117896653 [Drosophila subobscura]|uniref:uncharacterized protein LOC117896653 n=1 Tax=Drosophila subobscura TaxID=7241 RepID=UPI00155B23D8|nr:uncharacterized protein LOC117896653 [Drosophila subobscura]